MGLKLIAINDIKVPLRIEVNSRDQLLHTLRAAHNFRDAMEITLKGTHFKYYICELTEFNVLERKRILGRAAYLLRGLTTDEFIDRVVGNDRISPEIFRVAREG